MAVKLVTDSTVCLTPELQEKYDITKVTLYIVSDGVSTPEVTMDYDEYYERLRDLDQLPTTSQPTTQSFIDAFTKALDNGDDVLAVLVSGALSGTVDGAITARTLLEEQRPDAKGRIAIVNSMSCGMGLFYPLIEAAELAATGASLEQCTERAEYVTSCTRFMFAPTSLEYLRKGGRIGRAGALLGTALKMIPILGPDKYTGAVHVYGKIRTYRKALETINEKMHEDIARSGGLKALSVQYIAEENQARTYLDNVVAPGVANTGIAPEINAISPVVGTHVGPAVGIAYVVNEPVAKEEIDNVGLAARVSERVKSIRGKE